MASSMLQPSRQNITSKPSIAVTLFPPFMHRRYILLKSGRITPSFLAHSLRFPLQTTFTAYSSRCAVTVFISNPPALLSALYYTKTAASRLLDKLVMPHWQMSPIGQTRTPFSPLDDHIFQIPNVLILCYADFKKNNRGGMRHAGTHKYLHSQIHLSHHQKPGILL